MEELPNENEESLFIDTIKMQFDSASAIWSELTMEGVGQDDLQKSLNYCTNTILSYFVSFRK